MIWLGYLGDSARGYLGPHLKLTYELKNCMHINISVNRALSVFGNDCCKIENGGFGPKTCS